MDRYQLVKLVDWVGKLQSRKRMQKVVYLLQAAGCPYNADFFLHHYGPYSTDLAQLTDELVRVGLLVEQSEGNAVGKQFSYSIPEVIRSSLRTFEQSPSGTIALEQTRSFEELAKRLLGTDVARLEHASTVAFFKQQGCSWEDALKKTCEFKQIDLQGPAAKSALELAEQVMGAK